jgi:hypothetical protein
MAGARLWIGSRWGQDAFVLSLMAAQCFGLANGRREAEYRTKWLVQGLMIAPNGWREA